MEIKLKPWKDNEKLYFYPQSTQIAGQTGQIGRLRADFGSNGNEFWTTWEDIRGYLKTEDFKSEFDEVIKSLRTDAEETPFCDRRTMTKLLNQHENAKLPGDGEWHGFRADTDNYSYLFRIKAEKGDYNMYCFCYKKDWLDSHMLNAKRGVRFITSNYEEKFKMNDGDRVLVTYDNLVRAELTVRYVDDYHLEIGNSLNTNLYHICEYAEKLERINATIVPLDDPMITRTAKYYCPLSFSTYENDVYTDYEERGYVGNGKYAAKYEYQIKEALEAEHSYEGCDEKSMATYQNNPKIRSVKFDVENMNGTLYGCIKAELTAELLPSEENEFIGWLTGQCSDGFGEGFEQSEIDLGDMTGYLSFWNNGNSWFMKSENDFRNFLNQNNSIEFGGM